MRAEMGLPSVKGDDEHGGGMTGGFGGSMGGAQGGKGKRPITVKFEIPYFTTSGIQVRYLKIIEPKVSGPFPCILVFQRRSILRSAYRSLVQPAGMSGRIWRASLLNPVCVTSSSTDAAPPMRGDAVKGVRFRDPRCLTDSVVPGSMCRAT